MARHRVKTSKIPLSKMKIHNKPEHAAYKSGRGNVKIELAKQIFAKHNKKMKGV